MSRRVTKFLIAYHRQFMLAGFFLLLLAVVLPIAGCGVPTWLTDAGSIIGEVGLSVTSIGSFIAGLTGNVALAAALAVVSTWIGKISTGLSDLEELIQQYDQTQNPTLLTDIEAGLSDVQQNLQQDFSNLGLPSAILGVIEGIAGLALSQLVAWGSLIPALKATAGEKFTLTVPMTKNDFRAQVNAILSKPTGDAEVDAALAKVKRL